MAIAADLYHNHSVPFFLGVGLLGGLGLLGFAVAGFSGAGGFESGEQVGVFVFANL